MVRRLLYPKRGWRWLRVWMICRRAPGFWRRSVLHIISWANHGRRCPRSSWRWLYPGSDTDPERYGRIVHILGYVHFHLGNYARSQAYQQEAYLAHQRIGDTNRVAWDLIDIGSAYLQLGRYNEAKGMLEQGVETARTIGARPAEAYGLHYLGYWELYQGHYPAARGIFPPGIGRSSKRCRSSM